MKIINFIEDKIIVPLAVSLFMFSCVWMLIEAISRRFFNTSYNFSEELVLYSLIWALFLTLGKGGKNRVHIAVDLVTSRLGPKMLKVTQVINGIIGVLYATFMIIVSFSYIKHLANTGITSHSSLQIPLSFVFIAVPIGMFFLAMFYVDEIKQALNKKSKQPEQASEESKDVMPLQMEYEEAK